MDRKMSDDEGLRQYLKNNLPGKLCIEYQEFCFSEGRVRYQWELEELRKRSDYHSSFEMFRKTFDLAFEQYSKEVRMDRAKEESSESFRDQLLMVGQIPEDILSGCEMGSDGNLGVRLIHLVKAARKYVEDHRKD